MVPNVLLVVLDSVRAKNASLYDHSRDTTPFLSDFASRSVVYDQARTPGARSITGHASLFTGCTVEEHGLTTADKRLRSGTTIFERLQSEGYETGVFSENVWITHVDSGLRNGFETVVGPQNVPYPEALDARRFVAERGRGKYREFFRACLDDDRPLRSLANGFATKLYSDYPSLYPFDASAPGDVYVDRFLDWQREREGPWAACVNLMDAHSPYEPKAAHNRWGTKELLDLQERTPNKWELQSQPESFWKLFAIESLYDGSIHQLDSLLERLFGTLERRDVLEETLVVVTSDHGDGFGEPSRVRPGVRVIGHNSALHESVLHVPLVVHFPGNVDPHRTSNLASTTQFPSVVEAALDGEANPEQFFADTVHATSYGLLIDEQLRSRAERHHDPDSLDGFTERIRAVYEEDDDGWIRKRIACGDTAVVVRIRDAQTAYVEAAIDPTEIDRAFDSLSDTPLTEDAEGLDEVDQATQQRLEKLGYM